MTDDLQLARRFIREANLIDIAVENATRVHAARADLGITHRQAGRPSTS